METQPHKPWWQSKSIIGSLVTVAAVVAGFFGLDVDPATQAFVVSQLDLVMTAAGVAIGAALAIYGRVVARQPISRPGGAPKS
jgi:hypothetical protein